MARYLCCADMHVGQGADLGLKPGDRVAEQAAVWERILALADEHDVDAVLFAGDMWERKSGPTPDEMLAVERPLARRGPGVPLFAVLGNHDVRSVDAGCGLDVLHEAGLLRLSRAPELIELPGGVALATLPWSPVSRLVASQNGGDRDALHEAAANLLLDVARGLRAQADGPMILMLHWSVSGAVTPMGADTGVFREVVLDASELSAIGFDVIVCGHIHKPQNIATSITQPLFYTGSPLPLNFGEAGCDHGVWLLEFDDGGVFTGLEFLPIESRRFVTVGLDFMVGDLAPLRGSYVKIRGAVPRDEVAGYDVAVMRHMALEAGAHRAWVQLDVERDARVRDERVTEDVSETEALQRYLAATGVNGGEAAALMQLADPYLRGARA